jgi:hypothetical protein
VFLGVSVENWVLLRFVDLPGMEVSIAVTMRMALAVFGFNRGIDIATWQQYLWLKVSQINKDVF